MTFAHPALLLAACAPDPVVGEARSASVAQTTDPFLRLAWTAESDQVSAYFGGSVSSAGDVNGDGYGDVVIGADGYDNGDEDEGRAYVYLGSATGLDPIAAWSAKPDQGYAFFGGSVASAGDVNGDGYGDVVIGADDYANGSADVGRAYVYLGSAVGLDPTAAWTAESGQSEAHFGRSVSSAGDVNGDGYGDVIVGADRYDNGSTDEGRAYVYLGSAVGLDPTAAWAAESDQSEAYFGYSVSSAGDVNSDGYGDIIVGAPWYDNGEDGEGRAYVYFGSAAGLEPTAAWTAEPDLAGVLFGYSVSSAGDVNGDGYGDLIVGAKEYDGPTDEGRAYVYLGSAVGLDSTAAWTADSDQSSAHLGASVSSAGDVNGDGYGDVIVGADRYHNGSTLEGRAYVYLGSAVGLDPTAAWSAESDQSQAYFGHSVSSAGDVNGDGYGDVVVGAHEYDNGSTDEGLAFLFEGGCYTILPVDSDADNVDDACDRCPGFDDALDTDDDRVPDDCDGCPTDADPGQEDDDADGIGDACDPCPGSSPDADHDGFCEAQECDDSDPSTYPGAAEVCDQVDNNCDGDLGPNELDADGDLFSPCDGDCDDAEPLANISLTELCGDDIDNDCDGVIDDETCNQNADDTGCGCNGAGDAGAPSLVALAVLLRAARRRR